MPEVVLAFVGAKAWQAGSEQRPEGLDGPATGRADDGFQLREAELDGVEIGAVRRQIYEGRADAFNREANAGDFVDVEIVSDDHIPGVERGDQHLLDVGEEAGTIDRAIEDAGGGEAGDTERGEERTRLPPATRGVVMDAGAAHRAAVPPKEIGGHAGFVEKHEVRGVPPGRRGVPVEARARDVRPVVFGRAHRVF